MKSFMKVKTLLWTAWIGLCCSCTQTGNQNVSSGFKDIVSVEAISVEAPVGTAPRLPFQVWVTYSDGSQEFRQAKWSNSSPVTEEAEANPQINPTGTTYSVKGYILGDNTTPNGYPISASIKVVDQPYATPSNTPVAETLPLDKVSVTGDNRLTWNRDLDIDEILKWDVSQQLYNYRDTYGLSTEGYKESDGWDSPTTKLKGHGTGHYMSALAFAFASCQDPAKREQLKQNITRMVNELRECQERTFVWDEKLGRYWEARDLAPEAELRQLNGTWADFDNYKKEYQKYGYGYLNAIPAQHPALIEMYRAYNNDNWVWAPYYSIHKQLAGLIDIATYIDDQAIADKALLIAKDMGLWVWNRLHYRTYVKSDGTQEERRAKPGNRYEMWNMYIAGEVGGMSESLARLSAMVKDATEKERLLEASNFFDSPAFFQPLSINVDAIRTRHANQHIPMIIGALRSFRLNNNPYYYHIAQNFWSFIQGRYRYAMGGVGNGEMFRQPYTQILNMATNASSWGGQGLMPEPTINETCCAYNLAKLTKDLNCFNPDDASYMDYYERILYNQIVGSVNPHKYETTYQYAVGLNASKPWGNATPQESCCGGTGSENHVKYQEAVYFVGANTIWIGLYMPTTAEWEAKGVTLQQECAWPAERSVIRITKGSGTFAMKLRVPYWATNGFDVKLNGKSIAEKYQPSSYVTIPEREWTSNDKVEIIMPFTKHIDFAPDKMETAVTANGGGRTSFEPMWAGAFMYGPLVMASTGYETWEDATIDVKSDLSDVKLNKAKSGKGLDANVYTMTFNGKTFIPDYYGDENITHYFRMNILGDPNATFRAALQPEIQRAKIFKEENYEPASFTTLKSAVAAADKLYESTAITQADTQKVISAIQQAIQGLKQKGLDKAFLEEVISKADALDAKLYTSDSWTKLQTIAKEAKTLIGEGKVQSAIDLKTYELGNAIADLVPANSVDKSGLEEVMQIAKSCRDAQQAWNKMTVKVPEYAPWAPHGFARLMEEYDHANGILNNPSENYSQDEVDKAAASLNAAINAMRPGNLPELEDLTDLLPLIEKAKATADTNNDAVKQAIGYAEMVVRYVSDGSGTHDMIQRATDRMKRILK